jgi:hemerythrin
MNAFHWNDCFVTGLPRVDEQHHGLVDLINRFGEIVMRPDGASASELDTVFSELAGYAQQHFAEEEALMETQGIDLRHIATHRQSHADFLDEVMRLQVGVAAGDHNSAKSLLEFLTHWLAYHILGSDQVMARQMRAIDSGQTAEAAFMEDSSRRDPATATLLGALNGLFQQVSERNRELEQANRTLEVRVAERTQALRDANQQLEDLANTDALTKLPNRRFALRRFGQEWAIACANGTPLSCMMIDADGFKVINDSFGHDAGDTVLRTLSREMQNALRTDDIVCRLGGDEFLVICPNTQLQGALALAEKIRIRVDALRVPAGAGEWKGSISVGVAARTDNMNNVEGLIKAADQSVYIAKRNGRNCVASAVVPTNK